MHSPPWPTSIVSQHFQWFKIFPCFRNKAGLRPRQMAEKRGVATDVIHHFRRLEKSSTKERQETLSVIVTFFKEIHQELGVRYTLLFILGLLFVVLYITFTITGMSRHFETRDPIIVETESIKIWCQNNQNYWIFWILGNNLNLYLKFWAYINFKKTGHIMCLTFMHFKKSSAHREMIVVDSFCYLCTYKPNKF